MVKIVQKVYVAIQIKYFRRLKTKQKKLMFLLKVINILDNMNLDEKKVVFP